MGRITLVCTTHRDNGKCNEAELVKILLAIGPEVIFEEIRPDDYESIYADESKYSLEMRAIKEYLKGRKARQVPVDDYEIPEGFMSEMRALNDFVDSRSDAYCDAMDEIDRKQFELGFNYLNSSEFDSSIKKSELLYREAVLKYGNNLAKSKLLEWNDQIRKRETSMLGNLYSFCQHTDFMEGVFLVGSAHMHSIMDGIEQRLKDQPTLITWRFWNRP
jgi:hypothetical protein